MTAGIGWRRQAEPLVVQGRRSFCRVRCCCERASPRLGHNRASWHGKLVSGLLHEQMPTFHLLRQKSLGCAARQLRYAVIGSNRQKHYAWSGSVSLQVGAATLRQKLDVTSDHRRMLESQVAAAKYVTRVFAWTKNMFFFCMIRCRSHPNLNSWVLHTSPQAKILDERPST